jgi:hypothetical protein
VLEDIQPSTIKLRTLAAKGQVFKFVGYAKLQNAVALLTWQFDRIEAFVAITGSPSLNWEHPSVLKHLKDIMAIDLTKYARASTKTTPQFSNSPVKPTNESTARLTMGLSALKLFSLHGDDRHDRFEYNFICGSPAGWEADGRTAALVADHNTTMDKCPGL